jgi:hypothetical protein
VVSAQRFAEAERVYRADLAIWPENGWSLQGLARCLDAQGQTVAANEVKTRFAAAWQRADRKIETSCLCVPGGRAAVATLRP